MAYAVAVADFSGCVVQWLLFPTTQDTVFSVSNAFAVLLFLWLLKIYLAWWWRSVKHVEPLAAVPRLMIPLLGAADFMLCFTLAMVYWFSLRLARVLHGEPSAALLDVLPLVLGGAVVTFSILSCRINQIYGTPLNVQHLRAVTSWHTMRDSIAASIDPMLAVLFVIGICFATWGGRILQPLFQALFHGYARIEIWLLISALAAVYGLLALARLRGLYVYGLKQNAVLSFIRYYERRDRAVNVAEKLRGIPPEVEARDEEFCQAKPICEVNAIQPTLAAARLPQSAAEPFNVLIILLESTPFQYIDARTTPNLARLAASGVRFENHFTTNCETCKAIYSLMYSDHVVQLGGLPREVYGRAMPQPSLASVLREHGYQTGFFHSGNLNFGDKAFVLDGFDTQTGAETLRKRGGASWAWGVFEEEGVAATCEWIRAQADRPFFATYALTFPHHPYACPLKEKPFPTSTWNERFRNSLFYADQNIGNLLEFLRVQQLDERTIVIAVSDHGETTSTWPIGHGVALTMEELRVPWIFANPRLLRAAERFTGYTHHLDIAPTLLSLLNIAAPQEWMGRNLFAPSAPPRAFPIEIEQSSLAGVIDNGLLYAVDRKSGRDHLFQIAGDDLLAVTPLDANHRLIPAYRDRSSLYEPWAAWRHYTRAQAAANGAH